MNHGPTEKEFQEIEDLTDAIVATCHGHSPHIVITTITALLIKMVKLAGLRKENFLEICDEGWDDEPTH
jgi:hypothetical protein